MPDAREARVFSFQVQGQPGGEITVALHGDLDMVWAVPLGDGIAVLLAFQPESLAIDLRGLTFLDSSGVSYLLHIQEAAEVPVRFVRPGEDSLVLRLLQVTGVQDVLHLVGADNAPRGSGGFPI